MTRGRDGEGESRGKEQHVKNYKYVSVTERRLSTQTVTPVPGVPVTVIAAETQTHAIL